MPIKILFALIVLFATRQVQSQQVSTLLTDSTREFEAIHWNADGRIYAVDYVNGRLYQVYLNGTVTTLVNGFNHLAGGGFDANGTFYFSGISDSTVFQLNSDNTYTQLPVTGLNQPVGIIPTNHPDTLLVTEYGKNSVTKFSISTGGRSTLADSGGISGPDGIIRDWNDNILVANFNNHKITRVFEDGTTSLFSTIPSGGFMGYLTQTGNYLYVPSITSKRIYRVDSSGNSLVIAGTGTPGFQDGPGSQATFTGPNGIAHSPNGDTLLISDGNRIRMITNFQNIVGLEDRAVNQKLDIWPNPAKEILNIQSDNTTLNAWQIYGTGGRLIGSGTIENAASSNNHTIALDTIPKGNYLLLIHDRSGNIFYNPFLKE